MKISYKRLWKLLIDKEISAAKLHKETGISSGSMTKLRHSEPVSLEILWKVCAYLGCNIGDIAEFEFDGEGVAK